MRIKLSNFRCYIDGEYELPDRGMILLSGSSGSGKSSLLKAILYALYGVKAVRKPYAFGSNKCSVTLEFLNLKIQRSNRPNRLIVNDDIEDATAQAYIDEKLGFGYDQFMISSYIPQKNNTSILSLAQTEQLQLIKTLAFEGTQNERYKSLLKDNARESSNLLVEKRAQVEFTERELDKIDIPTSVKFPLPRKTRESVENVLKQYHERLDSFSSRMGKILEERSKLSNEIQNHIHKTQELELNNDKLTNFNNEIIRVNNRLDQLHTILADAPVDIEEKITNIKKQIKYNIFEKEYTASQKEFEQLLMKEKKEHQKAVKILEKNLWNDENEEDTNKELANLQKELEKWNKYKVVRKQLESFKLDGFNREQIITHYTEIIANIDRELDNLQEKLTLAIKQVEMEKNRMQCPECNASLYLRGKTLVSTVENTTGYDEHQIRIFKKQISTLKKDHDTNLQLLQRANTIESIELDIVDPQIYKEMRIKLEQLTQYMMQNMRRQDELARLKRQTKLSPALEEMKKTIDSRLEILQKNPDKIADIENLQKQLFNLEANASKYKIYKIEMENLEKENDSILNKTLLCQNIIKKLKAENEQTDIKILKKELLAIDDNIVITKNQHLEDKKLSTSVEAYIAFQEQEKQLKYWQEQLENAKQELQIAEKTHTANVILKNKYTQAEIMALDCTIESINEHTRYYLDTFFTEHQLKVVLETIYKGIKNKSFQINTMIEYRGNEYDSISSLSGGEFDRCTLASICGINSMIGSPILILDESLSSLDTDANTEIIRFLGELAQDKLILVCSHEAVTGIFDDIIMLEKG
jgi:DNA repair exonuclease SbcCD ATPase subunit